ncbi:MAG: aspartate carbamoyltransferase [bacterium]|nr:aspartate carbamoyltransferase [bacterium]
MSSHRNRLHPLLLQPVSVRDGVRGIERPQDLLDFLAEDPLPLTDLANHHIVSARQFTRESLIQLCRVAASYECMPMLMYKPLAGKLMISAFYEPSTRTRISFESAWHRLGGDIMSITDPATTGMAKGESLQDVAEMFSNYGDLMVLRDNDEDSIYNMLESLRIPIINAGNGVDEHPTQALADLYTLLKWRPGLVADNPEPADRIKVGIIGTPGRMRTVRSLLILLSLLQPAIEEIIVINPGSDLFSPGQREELEQAGLKVRVEKGLKQVLPELDVVYINSIAWVGETYETLTGDLKLSSQSALKAGSIILHPLARGAELDESLDPTPHNWYFAQARGAVFVRMALLTCLVQRINQVLDAPAPEGKRGPAPRNHSI